MANTKNRLLSRLLEIRLLSQSSYVLRLERNGLIFKAGQYVVVNIPGERNGREYSIFSPEEAPYLEILIKEVPQGEVSVQLKRLRPGAQLEISGPYGFFILREEMYRLHYLIATGTGISPFHSMAGSYPELNYKIIHGISHVEEALKDLPKDNYLTCTSRSPGGYFHGRVTDWLKEQTLPADGYYYLCGNSAMVNEATDILEQASVPPNHIRTETFF